MCRSDGGATATNLVGAAAAALLFPLLHSLPVLDRPAATSDVEEEEEVVIPFSAPIGGRGDHDIVPIMNFVCLPSSCNVVRT
ncbi:hypothetical protein PIB30_023716 [Stylosanthes scabra]|uniref:Secreted protein n=1 Tax=Stylosanthes scabra TaxID=79078 RepID=A0ABU6V9S2_9FABA|nr:hypothetical protein [Stylosanthes scabra]